MKTGSHRVVWLALVGLALAACGPAGKSDYDAARARWKAKGPANYQYTLKWSCFCGSDFVSPMRVTVRDGQVAGAVDVASGQPVDPSARQPVTIDGLFDKIQDAFNRNASEVTVTYDPVDGHPTEANINYQANVADAGLGFTAQELVPQ